jgi:hypothetical protein
VNDNRDQPAMEPLAPDATEAAVKNAEVAVRLKTNGDPRKQLSGSDDGFVFRLILPFEGRLLAIVSSSATTCLWELFRRSRTPLRGRPETVRLHPGTGVHLHPGILFGIIADTVRNHPGIAFILSRITQYLMTRRMMPGDPLETEIVLPLRSGEFISDCRH